MAEKPYEDYGHLYRKEPAKVEQPRSVEELASVLKRCNREGKFVALRNTAHSTNGQTLTSHVQLNLSALTERKFDRDQMTVTTGPTFAMGGRRYLYGYHNLTREQVIQQYGLDVIQKWNGLKKQVDPNGLLNMGVIRHLDEN